MHSPFFMTIRLIIAIVALRSLEYHSSNVLRRLSGTDIREISQ